LLGHAAVGVYINLNEVAGFWHWHRLLDFTFNSDWLVVITSAMKDRLGR
jgi:hypothetical protein